GINHVRRYNKKFDLGPVAEREILIAEGMLCGAAVAVVGDHDEAEILVAADPGRLEAKETVFGDVRVVFLEGADHVLAPGIGAGLSPEMPDSAGPGFRVEKVVVVAPKRVDRDNDGNDRQRGAQAPGEGLTRRTANPAETSGKAQPALEPPLR